MLLRKGECNEVCMLPTTEYEERALARLMRYHEESHVAFLSGYSGNVKGIHSIVITAEMDDDEGTILDSIAQKFEPVEQIKDK
jgi:translation elongation factor EF-1beta